MHAKRLLSAIIFIPLFLLTIYKGTPIHFLIFISIFMLGGLYECFIILKHLDIYCYTSLGYLLGLLLLLTISINNRYLLLVILLITLILLMAALIKYQYLSQAIYSISGTLLGLFYISLLSSFLFLIRNNLNGRTLILFFFAFIWAGDTFAFYIGTTLGKHKIWPAISPKKSIEGAIGGLLGNLLIVILFKTFLFTTLNYWDCLWITLLAGIMGQLGDFFESLLKRSAQIKDSGNTIPGHGGILDRMDSILFAAPVFYYYLHFFTTLLK